MAEYIASFLTGFGEVVQAELEKDLPEVRIRTVYDGLVYFQWSGPWKELVRLPYLNNIFYVMRAFRENTGMTEMAAAVLKEKPKALVRQGSFRIRYSEANQFVGMPKDITRRLETYVSRGTSLSIDRVNPQTEFWFLKRSEGAGFFGQLLHKRESTEKNLHPGELRPELAYLMPRLVDLPENAIVADPFAGYGAIPRQLAGRVETLYVSDLDGEKVENLKQLLQKEAVVFQADALQLPQIPDHSLDAVFTDPPWGYYEEIENIPAFYGQMLECFGNKLKETGCAVVLSARKLELEQAAEENGWMICRRVDTLVNGKKAAILVVAVQ